MRTHIDWITFTMSPVYRTGYPDGTPIAEVYADALQGAFLLTFGAELTSEAFGGNWSKNERSRAPYVDAWKLADGEITLFASPSLNHCCVEISGQGCERLISLGLLASVLAGCRDRVTRIDIACDIETAVKPTEFVATTAHERMRASGTQVSETGETCYIGSQKSDRYARVYRYNAPHPRSHLLRVEHVFRKEYAKSVAALIQENDMASIASACGKAFGWSHSVWRPDGSDGVVVRGQSGGRREGATVHWLVNSCAPAFKKLCRMGIIDNPQQFINQYFLPEA